jgi:hypothetical protein
MMRTVPVATQMYSQIRFASTRPKVDVDGNQRENKDGQKLHTVALAVADFGTGSVESFNVTVAETTPGSIPGEGLQPFDSCKVDGLRAGFWISDKGTGAWYFNADSVSAVRATPVPRESAKS